jgi:oligopeptide/dipeptide ABC transporter ATP-binding protein
MSLLEANNLTIQYQTTRGEEPITAVSDVSFSIEEGEFFGLAGESGCGKSTIADAIIGALDDNGYIESGSLYFQNQPLHEYSEKRLNNEIRWKEISMIPQSAMNSLDPLERISEQAYEITNTHVGMSTPRTKEKLSELFDLMGLPPDRITDYPHQFSGGMLQRATIALSLLLEPTLIIADEPTTGLDVVMQDQVFKYLAKIKKELNSTVFLITHDVSLIFEICQTMGVMHGGQLMEVGDVKRLFDEPTHPYSIMLQRAFPDVRFPDRTLEVIPGHPPENMGEVDYCSFADRCPLAVEECTNHAPTLEAMDVQDTQSVACFRKNDSRTEMETEEAEPR